MALRNHQITTKVEELTTNFREFLSKLNNQSRQQNYGNIDPRQIIAQLLYNPTNQALTLEQINSNYRVIKGNLNGRYDLITNNFADPNDAITIAQVATIQLDAIAAGFTAVLEKEDIEAAQQHANNQSHQPRVTQHIHYHQGYQRDPWLDFYRDYWFYQMMFGSTHHHHHHHYDQPRQPTTNDNRNKDNNENEVTWAGILLGVALVAGATATLGYSVMQTYYSIDEIVHNEAKLANVIKLTATGFAAWSGFMLGAALGATYFANPILGAVCTAIIASAAGMKTSKWAMELAHQANTHNSAVAHDPRFCLSANERILLESKNFDADTIEEALREISIMMKEQPANGLKFWHNPHRELINLMRELKQGYDYNVVNLNDKNFVIKRPVLEVEEELPIARVLYPATDVLYEPVPRTEPQTYGNYPTLEENASLPPSYQSLYNIEPSAPPMYA